MNEYRRMEQALKDAKCSKCLGLGKVNDAGPGDISYNEWECSVCKGTGIKPPYKTAFQQALENAEKEMSVVLEAGKRWEQRRNKG